VNSRARLAEVAQGRQPADLVLTNGRVFNVVTGELLDADLAVYGDTIAGVGTYHGLQTLDVVAGVGSQPLGSPEDWWPMVLGTGYRGTIEQLDTEARERVRAAICNSGFLFPAGKILVNLSPAEIRKEGPAFDLPIAVGLPAGT